MNDTNAETLSDNDYPFGCSCGEQYNTIDAAIRCRKCWVYTEEGFCTVVVVEATGVVVWESPVVTAAWSAAAAREAVLEEGRNVTFTLADAIKYQLKN